MMHIVRVVLAAGLLSGCVGTYPASVSGSLPDVVFLSTPSRVVTVGLSIDANDKRFSTFAYQDGFVCTAHRYPVDVGAATAESIEAILSVSFNQVMTETNTGHPLHYVIEPDYVEAKMLGTLDSWVTGAYAADVEISLQASVYDQQGVLLLKRPLLGHGSARSQGSVCPKAAIAVGDAATLAVHDVLDDFVEFVTVSPDASPNEISVIARGQGHARHAGHHRCADF
jgi:hypothetical protein